MERTNDEINDLETLKKIQFFCYPAIPVFSALLLAIMRDQVADIVASYPAMVVALDGSIVAPVAFWISTTTHEFQLWQRYIRYLFQKWRRFAPRHPSAQVRRWA